MGSFEKEPKTEQTTKINGCIIVFFLIITWLILLTVWCVCEDNDSADRDRCGPLSYDFIICNILRESLSNRDSIEIATVSGLSVRCRRRWHEGVKVTSWATSQFIQPISSRADASSCFFLRHSPLAILFSSTGWRQISQYRRVLERPCSKVPQPRGFQEVLHLHAPGSFHFHVVIAIACFTFQNRNLKEQ